MRKRANDLLKLATSTKQPVGILKNNKLKAYLIDAKTLESLETFVENYLDKEMIKERLEKTKKGDYVKMKGFLK